MVSFDRSDFVQTAVMSLAVMGAITLLGTVLSYWTWVWFSPKPEQRSSVAADVNAPIVVAGGLFGDASRGEGATAVTGVAIRLLGVVAASGRARGHAVLQLDPQQILVVREGEHVAPGIRLLEVRTDSVLLERGGVRQTLAWPEKNAAAVPAVPQVGR